MGEQQEQIEVSSVNLAKVSDKDLIMELIHRNGILDMGNYLVTTLEIDNENVAHLQITHTALEALTQ